MSRGHFERVRSIAEYDDLLAGTVVVARLDVAAQNHAVAEGHADPYPRPQRSEVAVASREENSHARASPQRDTPGGATTCCLSRRRLRNRGVVARSRLPGIFSCSSGCSTDKTPHKDGRERSRNVHSASRNGGTHE